MAQFLQQFSPFTRTRLVLSAWYTLILALILIGFSAALLVTYNNDVTRIVLRQDFGNHIPRTLNRVELRLVLEQVAALRSTSRIDIAIIDFITIVTGAILSYFLAGKTLTPIQKNVEGQKLFIADASHELKSPIATIQTACEVVLRKNKKTREEYKLVVEQIYDQSMRLGRLVNDLLLLSVLDTTATHNTLTTCCISDIVTKELMVMEALFKKVNLTVEKEIEPDIVIRGDSDKIRQLTVILLDNAIKYTPAGGKIAVTVRNTQQPLLRVADTGIGIPVEKQQFIFKRFYQADESHAGKGAGLGLAIAESIMKLHNGKILLTSAPGNGSEFTCLFPE